MYVLCSVQVSALISSETIGSPLSLPSLNKRQQVSQMPQADRAERNDNPQPETCLKSHAYLPR